MIPNRKIPDIFYTFKKIVGADGQGKGEKGEDSKDGGEGYFLRGGWVEKKAHCGAACPIDTT